MERNDTNNECVWYKVQDVMRILGIGRTAAGKIMRKLNAEMSEAGYIVLPGHVNRFYFEKRIGYDFSIKGGSGKKSRA